MSFPDRSSSTKVKPPELPTPGMAGGEKLKTSPSGRRAKCGQYHECNGGLANQGTGEANVAVGGALENAVESIEEPSQQASTLLSGPEQEGGKRRTEGEGVESREDHRYRDGHGELLIKATRNSWDKGRRYKHG